MKKEKKVVTVSPKEKKKEEEKPEVLSIVEVEKRIEMEPLKYITYSRAQLDQIKDVYAKGASDVEFANFILVSTRTGLDIFKKQIYLVSRWDSRLDKNVFTPQAGIDGFRAVAERTEKYAGNDDPIFTGETKEKYPDKALVTVYKIVEGIRCPFTASARWSEYYPGEKIGFMWKSKPHLMLGKCAEALALRKAFPNTFTGLYESAEMDMAQVETVKEDKQKKGLEKIKEIISKYSEAECKEYLGKIQKSEKYTPAQKKELAKLVDARLEEVTKITIEQES